MNELPSNFCDARSLVREEHAQKLTQVNREVITSKRLAYCSTPSARAALSFELAQSLQVLPLAVKRIGEEAYVTAVFCAPLNPNAVMALRFASGMEVLAEEAGPEILLPAIRLAYLGQAETIKEVALSANAAVAGFEQGFSAESSNNSAEALSRLLPEHDQQLLNVEENAIPKLLSTMLQRAVFLGASDIHVEPQARGSRVRFRVHGRLSDERELSIAPKAHFQLVRRIKVLAELNLNETRLPQEGGFTFPHLGSGLRLRVSLLPLLYGEKIVLRLLDTLPVLAGPTSPGGQAVQGGSGDGGVFRGLGLLPEQQQLLLAALASDRGALLLSGPTGSGKSTLLCAALELLNSKWRNIITLEDPIERVIQGINQTQVYAEKGLGYADILPKLLRQDPDVVMIGEIRDEQTADVALTAAITGSLVLSTVHAGGVFEVFTRLRQLGTKADLLAASLRLIVSQRLIGTNCTDCIEQEAVSPTVCSMFKLEPHTRLSSSRGCEHCGFSGVGGRRGFFELLPLHGGLRKILYRAGANASSCLPIDDLMKESMRQGFRPLALMVREALLSGEISAAAALKALGLAADVVFSNK